MSEKFSSKPPKRTPEIPTQKETFESLSRVFDAAEAVFTAEGRESAKPFLNKIYATLIELNKSNGQIYPLQEWNSEGELTEAEFNELNLRRKKLSNAIGIMTASGVVRHDLNEI
jgi:hypothetical protein